jgi:probable phosphoglycerate mutase
MKQFLTLMVVALFGLSACAAPKTDMSVAPIPAELGIDGVYLVRHAEKTTDKDDPALTEAGQARADALADLLTGKWLTHIYSTDTKRTRDTAAPVAERYGLKVELYDPRDLPAMAAKLKATPGRHLVVGHSNTTPQLTELLGGDGGTEIVEATEYDRLYWVTTSPDEPVVSYMTRFGTLYVADEK